MKILFASSADLNQIKHALKHADLIYSDLQADMLAHFILLFDDNQWVGTVGLERPAAAAWLRSLVVTDGFRGKGYGSLLVERIERYALDLNVERLYLLTQTAEAFFAGHGYQTISREEVPQFLQGSAQFLHLCPQTAACMMKNLNRTE